MEQKRKDQAPQAVFPCILKIIPGCVFNKRDPIIVGVDVAEGILRTGTPICVVKVDPETKVSILYTYMHIIKYYNVFNIILIYIFFIFILQFRIER